MAGPERTWAPEFFVDDGGRVGIIVSQDTASTPDCIFRRTPIRELPGLTGFARHFTVLKETV